MALCVSLCPSEELRTYQDLKRFGMLNGESACHMTHRAAEGGADGNRGAGLPLCPTVAAVRNSRNREEEAAPGLHHLVQ